MIDLKKLFSKVEEFDGDVYVADYTNQTNSAEKVKIAGTPFSDIAYFHLHNEKHVPLWAVNFEDNPTYIPEGVGNCECMVRVCNVEKGWWLLCSNRSPFVSFTSTQNDQIEWRKKNKIHLLGHNDVLVVNEGILNVLPVIV